MKALIIGFMAFDQKKEEIFLQKSLIQITDDLKKLSNTSFVLYAIEIDLSKSNYKVQLSDTYNFYNFL